MIMKMTPERKAHLKLYINGSISKVCSFVGVICVFCNV